MLRLTLRWEHWLNKNTLSLEPFIARMVRQCDTFQSEGDAWLAFSWLVTVGDALVEVRQWVSAANVYSHLLERASDYPENHPICLHAIAQCAYCHIMMGTSDQCKHWLDRFPRASAEALSETTITARAELLRYMAIEQFYARKRSQPVSDDTGVKMAELMKSVSIIVSSSPSNRVEYLRTLFYAVLARDVEAMSDS